MFAIAEEVSMCLEERLSTAQFICHASQRPHITRKTPLQFKNDFRSSVSSRCNQTSFWNIGSTHTSKVNETQMVKIRTQFLRANNGMIRTGTFSGSTGFEFSNG